MAVDEVAAFDKKQVQAEARHLANGDLADSPQKGVKVNNWSEPGPAAFDFRSDVITTPTTRMLSAIAATTLLDDVFEEDPTTKNLEAWISELTGKDAGLLVTSGTMGNQVSIRTHLQGPPHSILCDSRSHLFTAETGGVASLCGALTIPVEPRNGRHLTLEDLQAKVVQSDDVVSCPTRLISLENTLGGTILPLAECRRISSWARRQRITLHLDGARLWEAVAAGAGSLEEYCECFDSISLCFSKGLGAPIGSIIAGSPAFRERARWIRKSIGGGMRQAGVVSAAARVAVEETFLGGMLADSHARARDVARSWESRGGRLRYPVETNMVWLNIEGTGMTTSAFIEAGSRMGLKFMGERLVVHYQIGDEAVRKLNALFEDVLGVERHAP